MVQGVLLLTIPSPDSALPDLKTQRRRRHHLLDLRAGMKETGGRLHWELAGLGSVQVQQARRRDGSWGNGRVWNKG